MSDEPGLLSEAAESAHAERAPAPQNKRRGPWATIVGFAALALTKLKFLLLGLKALPFAKLLLTSGSMLVSIAIYAWAGGVPFAVGFVLMLLIHELGHGFAMRRHHIAAGYPLFIPMFGALIAMKSQPRTPLIEAEVAIAGPLAGTGAALLATALYFFTHQHLFLVLANVGFFMNLFNLTPFGFLDGGRIAALFSRKAWIVGALILAVMFFVTHAPQLLLIGLMALPHFSKKRGPAPGSELVTPSERLNMAFHYFGLCAFLAAGMYFSQRLLNPS